MTAFGITAGAFVVAMLLFRFGSLQWGLILSSAFVTGSALTLAGNSVPLYYAVAILAALALFQGKSRLGLLGPMGFFVYYALLVTIVGPLLFAGTPVITARGSIDAGVLRQTPLDFTVSNGAQAIYTALGFLSALYITNHRGRPWLLVGWPLATGVVLSFARLVDRELGLGLFPQGFFDNSLNFVYIETTPEGLERFRGIFSEPAGLAIWCVAALSFFAIRAFETTGAPRLRALAVIIMGALCMAASTATSAIVLPAFILLAGAAWWTWRFLNGQARIYTLLAVFGPLLLAGAVYLGGPTALSGIQAVTEKLGSVSFFTRSTADLYSVGLLDDSFGLGLGLGSNRPSSLFAMLLSCTGVIGTATFVVGLLRPLRAAWKHPDARAACVSLSGLMLGKVIVGADLNSPSLLWVLLGACAAAGAARSEALKDDDAVGAGNSGRDRDRRGGDRGTRARGVVNDLGATKRS